MVTVQYFIYQSSHLIEFIFITLVTHFKTYQRIQNKSKSILCTIYKMFQK